MQSRKLTSFVAVVFAMLLLAAAKQVPAEHRAPRKPATVPIPSTACAAAFSSSNDRLFLWDDDQSRLHVWRLADGEFDAGPIPYSRDAIIEADGKHVITDG